jgi:putative ABC transport system substrate-binding protein
VKRRAFIAGLGGASVAPALLPLSARAQQPAMPVIGLLDPRSPEDVADRVRTFRLGLKASGYVEGENIAIEYRWADNQIDRLPALAADLVRRRVAVIAVAGATAPVIAKAATSDIPIVFVVAEDPVRLGLVSSLARPNGNATGINFFSGELGAKRLEILRELVPTTSRMAALVNPAGDGIETTLRDVKAAAQAMGLQLSVLEASTGREIDAAFATVARERPDALLVGLDSFFSSRRVQIVQWAARHAIPTTYSQRLFADVGGLMTDGSNVPEAWRQAGVYVGRILKGAKPADLPVLQANKFELVINMQTARMIGLTVPSTLLATADEVIE